MKIVQFYLPESGLRLGLVREGEIVDITSQALSSALDLIEYADNERLTVSEAIDKYARPEQGGLYSYNALDVEPDPSRPHLVCPLHPPEVWACGVTYKPSADFRDEDMEISRGIYGHVYSARRPEIFFKATAPRCVGPNGEIGIRSDSSFTASEPELALALGSDGRVLGYMAANDVSAWDIERENPLYLPQSKIFSGCCALGPIIVSADEIGDPYDLEITCRMSRNGEPIFEGAVRTSQMKRKFEELITFLRMSNPIPAGTVMLTGTGIIVPPGLPLMPGDIVEITIDGIGTLRNRAKIV